MNDSHSTAPSPPAAAGSCVIDISHHNGKSLKFELAKADGIVGVIHKASQGTTGRDPKPLITPRPS